MSYGSYFGSFGSSAAEQYGSRYSGGSRDTWTTPSAGGLSNQSWAPAPTMMREPMDSYSSGGLRAMNPMASFGGGGGGGVWASDFGMQSAPAPLMSRAFEQPAYFGRESLSSVAFSNGGRFDNGYGRREERRNFYDKDNSGYRNDRDRGGRGSGGRTFPSKGGRDDRRDSGYDKNRRSNGGSKSDEYVPMASSAATLTARPDYVPSRIAPVGGRRSGGTSGGSGRGGASGGRGGRSNNNDRDGRMRKRPNQSTDITFSTIPSDAPQKSFPVANENLVCFHGLKSVFATQHEFPIVIDGFVYDSVDHFYQIEKVRQLCGGKACDKLEATVRGEDDDIVEIKSKDKKVDQTQFGSMAREFLKENKVDRPDVEKWRRSGGVIATQKAMAAKAQQCSELREMLNSSANKIIVHTYAGDAIFGSGTRIQFVHKWADELMKTSAKLAIPMTFPLDDKTIAQCPTVAKGRNLLGVILMQLADKLYQNELPFVVTQAALEFDKDSGSASKSEESEHLDEVDMEE